MELRHLRYFLALAEQQSFTRAADELHIVQPALSQQIKNLEQEFGLVFFRRDPGGTSLTQAGQQLLPMAQRIVAQVDQTIAELHQLASSGGGRQVSFGLMHSLGHWPIDVPELLAAFDCEHPNMPVRVHEGTTEELLIRLRRRQIDAAVIDLSLVDNPNALQSQIICAEPLVLIVANDHPLAERQTVNIAEFAQERFIQLAVGSATRLDTIILACKAAGFGPDFALFPANVPMARSLAAAGAGIYITYPWVAESPGPAVRTITLEGSPLVCQLALVWTDQANPNVKAFLRFAWPAMSFRGNAVQNLF